jgi:hypothetical protein
VRNACWHTHERIQFRRPEVLTETYVMKREGKRFIETRWEIQPGKTVELASATAVLHIGDPPQQTELVLHLSRNGTPLELQSVATMVGGYLPPPGEKYLRNFWMYLALPEHLGDSFRLVMPAYSVDGEVASLPDVRFGKETDVQFFAPIQC